MLMPSSWCPGDGQQVAHKLSLCVRPLHFLPSCQLRPPGRTHPHRAGRVSVQQGTSWRPFSQSDHESRAMEGSHVLCTDHGTPRSLCCVLRPCCLHLCVGFGRKPETSLRAGVWFPWVSLVPEGPWNLGSWRSWAVVADITPGRSPPTGFPSRARTEVRMPPKFSSPMDRVSPHSS